ncbi:uncharacterized protein [Anoplolepis gracilipes]|uniref:uncharacterized protein n=1 Tax=Anoplolepis gracilipes TaxID=354296 RepID=UPI003BA39900
MTDTLTIEKLIAFLKVDLLFACCWPLPPSATKWEKICNKIFRGFSVLHGLIMVIEMIYTIYTNWSDLFLIMKLSCLFCTTVEVPVQIICFSVQYDRLQYVMYELEDYCKRAKPKERDVFHHYIDSCKSIYIGSMCAFTLTAILFILSPVVEPQLLPFPVEYPFSVDYQPLKTIIYLHHVLLIYQSYMQVCSNIMIALLLWFVSARCDILSSRFRAVTKFAELRACIEEHQELLWYGKKVTLSIRYIILASLTISTVVIIFTGCTFLSRQPMSVKSTFLVFFLSSLSKVYLCAWPADHLLSASTNIAHAAYDSMWYNGKVDFQKNFVHTLLRGQQPIAINVPCMLPTVSLNYYASYVSTAFSYLTTFRIILEKDDDLFSCIIMENKVTLDKVIGFLRVYLTFACCWPLPSNATKLQRFLRTAFRYFCCVNSVILSVAAAWTIYKHNDNVVLVMKLGCQLSAISQVPLQLMLFALQDKRLQFIVLEMENYYQQAQKYEKKIFQQYVDKCKPFYGIILGWLAITGISVITTPIFSSQSFPSEAEYPFDVQYQPIKTLIYAHHILIAYQCVIQVSANTFPALLLWFLAARFHILSVRFRTMTNKKELIKYTREHYMLLRYAKEVTFAVRYVALLCVTFSTGAVIFGYLTFMSRQPWSVKWTFLMIAFCGFVELYMYAWPADNVMSTSSDIAIAAYNSLWYNNDLTMRKILVHVIQRSQHPVTISIPCALPNLSMNYYASYISTVFSYMALVRLMMSQQ